MNAANATTASVVLEDNPCWCKPVRLVAGVCTTCGHVWESVKAADSVAPEDRPATPEHIVLPVTGKAVPAAFADVRLVGLKEMASYDGAVAFEAQVKRGRTLLGIIEQDGHGGGTWFRPANAEARVWFDEQVAIYADLQVALTGCKEWAPAESLCNDLYEEPAQIRDNNRRRNVTFRLPGDDPSLVRTFQKAPAADPAVVAACKAQLLRTDPSAEVWNKQTSRWEPVSPTA